MTDRPLDLFLKSLPPSSLFRGEALSGYTTIKCGGPATALLKINDEVLAARALQGARAHGIPTLIIGNGSNLLIDDAGFDGLVLYFGPDFGRTVQDGAHISAQAGASLMGVSRLAAELGLSGLEFASGIPASVGGAALMNAGAYGGEMSRVITAVDCLNAQGERITLSIADIGYGYRHSRMMNEGYTVLNVHMTLTPAPREDIIKSMRENQAQRRLKQPLTYPSAGSFFKRPQGHFAGSLIEQAGLKGTSCGGAQVSLLHAGFLINTGGATAADFMALARLVQERVENMAGVWLEPEVRMVLRA